MKKKILIVSDSLRTGGIQSSLKAFLEHLPTEEFDVELFLFNQEGLKDAKLDKNIKIITGNKFLQIVSCTSSYAKNMGFIPYFIRKLFALLCKIFSSAPMYKFVFLFQKPIKDIDIAIAYSNNVSNRSVYFGYNLFVLKKVIAKQKIAYIHIDYNSIHSNYANQEYHAFNKILASSEFVKSSFLKFNPDLAPNCQVFYPFLLEKTSSQKIKLPEKYFNIVTVGRLDKNKSQIDSIKISEKLLEANLPFRWYLIGDGPERKNIESQLKNSPAKNNIILCGQQDSADYIGQSNLFVSLSKNESYGLAIAEAANLKIPIIALKNPAIFEILPENYYGICKTADEIAEKIIDIYTHKSKYDRIKSQTSLLKIDEKNDKILYNILNK